MSFNHDCRSPASELFALLRKARPYPEPITTNKRRIGDFPKCLQQFTNTREVIPGKALTLNPQS